MQVTNNSTITSTGFVISDTLDSRLQYISATPPLCTATGQAIRCNILQDLGPGDSYTLYLQVQVDPAYTGGEIIPNTACVIPFEDDTDPLNNCDDADVPTPVEMVSFTADGMEKFDHPELGDDQRDGDHGFQAVSLKDADGDRPQTHFFNSG